MKNIYFTPGPSELYPTVQKHIQTGLKNDIGSISHRSKKFQEIYKELILSIKKLLKIPDDYNIFVVGSATEAMERTLQNCVEKYSFHFVNGSFSKRFYIIAQELGKTPVSYEVPVGQAFDFKNVSIPKHTELICLLQNETSSGVMTPVAEIEGIVKKYPDKLIAVDSVSSCPYVSLNYQLLDIGFFSVQKLFGLPAGMGIMIVSPRAIAKSKELLQNGVTIGSYHTFPKMLQYAVKNQTHETPPVFEMYLLLNVIKDMQKKGIATIRKDTEEKADLLYNFLDNNKSLFAGVKDKRVRSQTVIVADIQQVKGDVKKALAKKGFIVGSGYGQNKETQIRIGNYPAISVRDVKRLIKELKSF